MRKIKSEEDYHVAMAWQGQPLVLNHLIIVLGGSYYSTRDLKLFSLFHFPVSLCRAVFEHHGFFQLKPTTKYDIQKALTEFIPLTVLN